MKIVSTPEQVPALFAEAWNNYDAEGIANLFAEEADFVNVTGLWWQQKKDIFKAHHYGLTVIFKQSTLKIVKTKVRYLSEHIATVHAKIKLTDQSPSSDGVIPQPRTTIFTFIVKKENNTWLCYAAQNTDVQPGKETFVRKENGDYEAVNYRLDNANKAKEPNQ